MRKGYFDKEMLRQLPADNVEALLLLSHEILRLEAQCGKDEGWSKTLYNDYLEAYSIFKSFGEVRKIDLKLPTITSNWESDIDSLWQYFKKNSVGWQQIVSERTTKSILDDKRLEYTNFFESVEEYEFNDQDFARVQDLINELRKLIGDSNLITPDHKRRLLRRLEAMQSEIHKKSSDIDRFWGFVAEAGIVTRKFGEDMKPISDRVTELGKIVIAVIMSKEGIQALPDITKLLEHL